MWTLNRQKTRGRSRGGPKRLTSEWFTWYGLEMGLSLDETMDLPLTLLFDLISIHQIKKEGYRYKQSVADGQSELINMFRNLK